MDNIHPAFADKSADFSSWGCQVIRGGVDPKTRAYTHEWALFRTALGLGQPLSGDHGRKFSYILLTGMEAALAARLREQGLASDFVAVEQRLVRLRHGSQGAFVARLRASLGLPEGGYFDAPLRNALVDRQQKEFGWADGIYSLAVDDALKLHILRPEPVIVAALDAAPGQAESVRRTGPHLSQLDSLYLELGRRAKAAGAYPEALGAAELPMYESLDQESLADLIAFGQTAFMRVERAAQELICGDDAADVSQRQQLQDALGQVSGLGVDQVTETLAAVLASALFLVPPINRIVAKIIVERIIGPAVADAQQRLAPVMSVACRRWAEDLNQRHGVTPAAAGAVSSAPALGTAA